LGSKDTRWRALKDLVSAIPLFIWGLETNTMRKVTTWPEGWNSRSLKESWRVTESNASFMTAGETKVPRREAIL
jgi:hypothetical protein